MRTATQTMIPDGTNQRIEIEKVSDGPITCLKLRGTINEQFEGKKLGSTVRAKVLVLDLSDVQRISSFGIREWGAFTNVIDRSCDKVYVIGCTPKVINQLGMVADFLGKGLIFSFYAPYRCDYCGVDRLLLLNVDRDRESIKKMKAPERICETCGNPEYFDEDPLTFFAPLAGQPEFELDPKVTTFLVSKLNLAVSDLARRLSAEKSIDGRNTYLKLAGNLDNTFPRDRLAEGLEGTIAIDVSGIGAIDPPGAAEFRRFLSLITPATERILLLGCQPQFLERATRPEDLNERVQILSLSAPYACGKCATTSSQLIDVEQHYDVLKIAMPPTLKCNDCGGPTTCVASNTLLSHLRNLPKPAVDQPLRKFIKKAQKQAPKKAAGAQAPAGWSRFAVASAAVAAVAVGTMAVITYYQQQKGQELVQKAVAQLSSSQNRRPQWITSDTPFSGYCTDLTARTVCVGVSSYTPTKEAARAEASDAALEALANTIGLKIDDPAFGQLVRSAYGEARRKALAELEPAAGEEVAEDGLTRVRAARQSVARALEKSGGAAVPTQIADWYWEEYESPTGSEFIAFVRYDVSSDEVKALVSHYSQPAEALGGRAITSFPSLAWMPNASADGAFLVGVNEGVLEKLGLGAKDVVLSVGGEPVRDAADFATKMQAEYAALEGNGGKVKLVVKRGDGEPMSYEGPIEKGAFKR